VRVVSKVVQVTNAVIAFEKGEVEILSRILRQNMDGGLLSVEQRKFTIDLLSTLDEGIK
jgi:hypothetical protein